MKRFEVIAEADARVLAHGETVMLARGGHVTPLAQDTLKERRVIVVHEGRAPDEASLVPRADIGIVATWLTTPMREPRYIRRFAKIRALEDRDWGLGTRGLGTRGLGTTD